MSNNVQSLLWIDLETTGLLPWKHSPIEIACIKTSIDAGQVLERYHTYICPSFNNDISQEAMTLNKLDLNLLKTEPSFDKAVLPLIDLAKDAILAGSNVSFDKYFLLYHSALYDINLKFADYHVIDVAALAWPLFCAGKIQSLSTKHLCKYFNIPIINEHQAMADIERSIEVYKALNGFKYA